jgi:hypothetical protein
MAPGGFDSIKLETVGFYRRFAAANGRETGEKGKCAAIMRFFRGNSDAV